MVVIPTLPILDKSQQRYVFSEMMRASNPKVQYLPSKFSAKLINDFHERYNKAPNKGQFLREEPKHNRPSFSDQIYAFIKEEYVINKIGGRDKIELELLQKATFEIEHTFKFIKKYQATLINGRASMLKTTLLQKMKDTMASKENQSKLSNLSKDILIQEASRTRKRKGAFSNHLQNCSEGGNKSRGDYIVLEIMNVTSQ